ncbi:hypothetical protein STEG23_030751 [Scotinomys teguina]
MLCCVVLDKLIAPVLLLPIFPKQELKFCPIWLPESVENIRQGPKKANEKQALEESGGGSTGMTYYCAFLGSQGTFSVAGGIDLA